MSLASGLKVTLGGDAVPGTGGEFLCLLAEHSYTSDAYGSGEGAAEAAYSGRYVLMPSEAPMAPERKTPAAVVQGPQTAVVVGEGEIDCDEYGRILVRFHWDLEGAWSMRCRVSQTWGGGGWGGMVIPRIGMEVVVEFLEGDPDKPLVTGCVYNGRNEVPYELPANKTRSTFRTKTHGGNGHSELTFEDMAGQEEVFLRSQKDLTIKVENHATERVNANKITSIGGASIREVNRSDTTTVGQNMTVNIGSGAGGNLIRGALGKSYFGVKEAAYLVQATLPAMTGHGNFSVNAAGSVFFSALKAAVQTVGGANMVTVGLSHNLTVGGAILESSGANSSETIGGTKTIDAHEGLLIRCGKSELSMQPDGTISLKGASLVIEQDTKTSIRSPSITASTEIEKG